jgi:tRNA G18 (ribose-2'-O)-methylase SpoU
MFRTADGAGVSKIYLTGYTPGPIDRFGRKVSAFTKVSLGAEDTVPWERGDSILELVQKLKKDGVQVVALEQDTRSARLGSMNFDKCVALIVGNEVGGITGEILDEVDVILEIPMRGIKESLNVSVAAGIALYGLTK